MNNSTASQCVDKITISSIFGAFQITNVLFCTFVTHRLTKSYKDSEINKSFYNFLANLLISDVTYFMTYLIGTFPQIFVCSGVLGDIGTMLLGLFDMCTFVPLATNIVLISLNRYFAICWPNANKTIFKDQFIVYYCCIGWLTGPLFVLFNYLIGCYMKFNESNPSFGLKCSSPNVITALSPHSIYLYICAYGTFIFYAMCIKKLRSQAVAAITQNIAASISRKQMHVFWQALFIWMSFVATISSFRVLPFIANTFVKFAVNITFSFGCLYSTPIIVICFSKRMRTEIVQLFTKGQIDVITPTSTTRIKNTKFTKSVVMALNFIFGIIVTITLTRIYKDAEIDKSFYSFIMNLLLAVVGYFLSYLVGTSPQIFTCTTVLGGTGALLLGVIHIVTFLSIATNILFISLNRYLAICWPQLNKVVFDDKYIPAYCVVAWFTGPVFLLLNYLIGCRTKFNEANLSFALVCESRNTIAALSPHSIYLYVCAYGTFIFYALCIKKLRDRAASTTFQTVVVSISKKQMHVFWQALCIWLSLVATITTYRVLPFISNMLVKFGVNIVFSFCCLYSAPIIVVCFSNRMRAELASLFKRTKINPATIGSAPITNTTNKKVIHMESMV